MNLSKIVLPWDSYLAQYNYVDARKCKQRALTCRDAWHLERKFCRFDCSIIALSSYKMIYIFFKEFHHFYYRNSSKLVSPSHNATSIWANIAQPLRTHLAILILQLIVNHTSTIHHSTFCISEPPTSSFIHHIFVQFVFDASQ